MLINGLRHRLGCLPRLALLSLKEKSVFSNTSLPNERKINMSLIRYQTPSSVMWPSLNRWASLRDDLDTLLELPFLGGGARQAQLFTGWTPALDLYQNNDNVVAVVELPGMRKDDIEISLHDGMLTIAGERKTETQGG